MNRQNPFQEIERMFDQLSRQFSEFEPTGEMGGPIAIDVADTGDAFRVTADVPSFESDDIQVTLPDPETVRIDASRTTETTEEDKDMQYIRQERQQQSFSRTIPLPESVDEANASADFDNGVLTVHLPKTSGGDGTNIPLS